MFLNFRLNLNLLVVAAVRLVIRVLQIRILLMHRLRVLDLMLFGQGRNGENNSKKT
jgi:hypothetical protein